MTFTDWIDSLPDDERSALCAYDAWKAGAMALFSELIKKGYIEEPYKTIAEESISNILG